MKKALEQALRIFMRSFLDYKVEEGRRKMGDMRNELALKEEAIRVGEMESISNELWSISYWQNDLDMFWELFKDPIGKMAAVYMRHRPEKGDSWMVTDPESLRPLFLEEIDEYLAFKDGMEVAELIDILNLGLILLARLLALQKEGE